MMKFQALMSLLLVSTAVLAGPTSDRAANVDRLVSELGLNESQAVQVEAILASQQDRIKALRDLPRSERRSEAQKLRADVDAQLRSVLSDEQMRQFETLRKEFRGSGRGGDRRGRLD